MSSKRFKKLPTKTTELAAEKIEKLLPIVKKNCTTKFDESVDLSFQINNKQKKSEINIRTIVNLPGGTGKKIKVAVVCEDAKNSEAKSAGADAALLVTPYYNKPTQEGLYLHYQLIADEVDFPQILYNVPSRTACFIEAETTHRLSLHENIIGIKDATGEMNNLEDIKKLCSEEIKDEKFFLYSGDDATSYEFLVRGGHGTISVSSNIVPNMISEKTRLAMDKNEAGKKIDEKINALNKILFVESNPIPVKYALHLMGFIKLGIRLPLTILDSKFHEGLKKELKNLELI